MKKKIFFIIGILCCNFCFGSIVLQNDITGLSWKRSKIENCFDVAHTVKIENSFLPIAAGSINVLWEFNTKNTETPFHFMTGLSLGGVDIGFTLSVPFVFEFTIAKFEKTMLEIFSKTNIGAVGTIFGFGDVLYLQSSLDLVWGRKDRKWFFGGFGVTYGTVFNSYTFEGFGKKEEIHSVLGAQVIFGIRFSSK